MKGLQELSRTWWARISTFPSQTREISVKWLLRQWLLISFCKVTGAWLHFSATGSSIIFWIKIQSITFKKLLKIWRIICLQNLMKIRYKEGMPRWILCLSYSTASKYLLCTFIYLYHTLLISTQYIQTHLVRRLRVLLNVCFTSSITSFVLFHE